MTPLELLFDLIVRAAVLSMPIAVGVLAFRRLLLSRTANAWVYALAVGYAAFSTMGLMPWAVGLEPVSASFIVLAMVCPPLWIAIVLVCGMGRQAPYKIEDDAFHDHSPAPLDPLLLTNPVVPEPVPVFRHHRRKIVAKSFSAAEVVNVAKSMRGRASSDERRVRKLLPPPRPELTDLPFLR